MGYLPAVSFFGVTSNQKSTFEKPRTVDDLKVSIREEIATVPQDMLVNVMQNYEERLRTCVRQEGRHFSDIIFRKWVINVGNQNCIYYRLFCCWHNFFILKINKVTIIWKTCIIFTPHCIRFENLHKLANFIGKFFSRERISGWSNGQCHLHVRSGLSSKNSALCPDRC
jgi:hypothetical protein